MSDKAGRSEYDTQLLLEELEQFKREKEAIRGLIGQIGGANSVAKDRIINIVFITVLALLLVLDLMRHFLHLEVPLPAMFSLELGIFLVSLKIIWMIHKQTKVEHFQFWILNSLEFRLNDIAKKLRRIERLMPSSETEGAENGED